MPVSVLQSSKVSLGLSAVPMGGALAARSRSVKGFLMQHQKQTQWCWAAVTSSVATFYRQSAWTQCRVVSTGLGQGACCSGGDSSSCNRPWYLDKALAGVGSLSSFAAGALTLADLGAEIDQGRPVAVRVGWATGGGHFLSLSGCSDQNVVDVQDPWYGKSTVDYNAFRLRYQGGGRWTHSYRTMPRKVSYAVGRG